MESEQVKKEEEKKEEPEKPIEDNDKGNKPESTELIDRASEERKKLEAALTKQEELVKRQEKLAARNLLGGKSDLEGAEPVKELTEREYADAVLRGEANPLKDDGFI